MMKLKKVFAVAAAFAAGISLAACSSSSSSSSGQNQLEKIKEKGTLVVATSPDYAPFEFQTLVDGKNTIVGADISLAQAIADELGVELEISSMNFDNVLTSVQSGKADIAIAGLSVSEEREKVFDFTIPYYEVSDVIVVKKDNLANYSDIASLSGKKVGVQKGTTQETFANENLASSSIVSLTNMNEVVNELKAGQIDAMVLDSIVATGYLAQNADLAVTEMDLSAFNTNAKAIALPKGSSELKEAIDKVITKLAESNTYQTYLEEASKLTVAE